MAEAETITVSEAAERLGVSGAEVLRRIDQGELRAVVEKGLVRLPVDQPITVTIEQASAMLERDRDKPLVAPCPPGVGMELGRACPSCGHAMGVHRLTDWVCSVCEIVAVVES